MIATLIIRFFAFTFIVCGFCSQHIYATCIAESTQLLPDDGQQHDHFGFSVDISGSKAIVGAWTDDDHGSNSGSAYIMEVDTGNQLFKLSADNAEADDTFGYASAIDGSYAVVGAWRGDGVVPDSGAAYVYDVNTGIQSAKLAAVDGAFEDGFGTAVDISNGIAIVGARRNIGAGNRSGAAYLYDVSTGEQLVKLIPEGSNSNENFGSDVAIDGNIAVIGSRHSNANGSKSGAAYIFNVATGEQVAKLTASDGATDHEFGISVGVSRNTVIVGSYLDNTDGQAGSAYLFDAKSGSELAKLVPNAGDPTGWFGYSVDVYGSTAVIGAFRSRGVATNSGSVYVFDTITHEQITRLCPTDAAEQDWLGWDVSLSGDSVIAGAYRKNDSTVISGTAYVFANIPEPTTATLATLALCLITTRRRR